MTNIREPASEFKAFEKSLHDSEVLADRTGKPCWLYLARDGYRISEVEPEESKIREGFKALKIHPSNQAHKF